MNDTNEDYAILSKLKEPIDDLRKSLTSPLYRKTELYKSLMDSINYRDESRQRQCNFYQLEIQKLYKEIGEIDDIYYPKLSTITHNYYKEKLG